MAFEVELKFPLANEQEMVSRLTRSGAIAGEPVEQSDCYFNHPSRDFRTTNEAFRIRSVGTWNCLTYKGPVIDRATKTRQEIEIPIEAGLNAAAQMADMLQQLGFRRVREVRKQRTPWKWTRNDWTFELALDRVPGLGSFLEIELIAEVSGRDAARDAILALAAELKLTQPEQRSYLELVIQAEQGSNGG